MVVCVVQMLCYVVFVVYNCLSCDLFGLLSIKLNKVIKISSLKTVF